MSSFELPAPGPDAAAHGARVAESIGARIDAAGGEIGFTEYMQHALYAPGLGYYSAGSRKLGAEGDFITAPELTPLFAQCVAEQVAEALALSGGDTVLEAGGGSGRLAADLLATLAARDALPARYLVLEVSAELRQRQQALLAAEVPALQDRVAWLDAWPEQPVRGAVVANELLDALPVECFRKRDGAVLQRTVRRQGEGFSWGERPAPEPLAAVVAAIEHECGPLPDGYASEACLVLPDWLAAAADRLEAGMLLLIDYGMSRCEYYLPERMAGTLRCHYRHRVHDDPFVWPGLQDITAQVDFTAVAAAAQAAGLEVAGYTTQAHFLLATGLDRLLGGEGAPPSLERAQQAKQLVLPGEMGERFKAIALTRGIEAPLCGFALRDLRARL